MAVRGDDEVWVQLATRIPKGLHRQLKLHCVQSDTSVMEFVVSSIEEKLVKAGGRKRSARSA
jgi:predicted HicB family RNase H-like nuclease